MNSIIHLGRKDFKVTFLCLEETQFAVPVFAASAACHFAHDNKPAIHTPTSNRVGKSVWKPSAKRSVVVHTERFGLSPQRERRDRKQEEDTDTV